MAKSYVKSLIHSTFIICLASCSTNIFAESKSTLAAKAYLENNVWKKEQRYDISHFLMIPMFYAFEKNDRDLIQSYHKYVTNFYIQKQDKLNFNKNEQRLTDAQFLYFLSTYAVLSENKYPEYSKSILKDIEKVWYEIPAWQWSRKPFTNMKERFDWKLQASSDAGYSRAIIDEELFILGAAANLTRIYPNNKMLKEINSYTTRIFKQRSHWNNDRWLFDVGVWDKHPSYAYVGYNDTKNIVEKRPGKNTVADSSHFFRMPVLLWSFQKAYPANSPEAGLFKSYRQGLEKQFFKKVVVRKDNKILLNNFMDGRNGVYRWKYQGTGKGHEAYGLSSSLGMGWWAMLPGERVQNLYKDYYVQLNTGKDKINCDVIMERMIKNPNTNSYPKMRTCFYLYNSDLASKVTNK